jgi:hypothetical protein
MTRLSWRGHKKLRSAFQEDEDFPLVFGHPILGEKATLILCDYLMGFPCYVMVQKNHWEQNGTKTRIHRKTSHFFGEHDLNASLSNMVLRHLRNTCDIV